MTFINFKTNIYSNIFLQESEVNSLPFMCPKKKLKSCIQLAASKLDDNNGSEDRIFGRIRDFIILLTEDQYSGMSSLLWLAVSPMIILQVLST